MNDIMYIIYLADIVDNLRGVFVITIFIFIIIGIFLGLSLLMDNYDGEEDKRFKLKCFKRSSIALGICFIIISILPSKQSVYIMTGLKTGNEIIHSETGTKALKILNLKLDEYLNDLQKEENK